MGDGYSQIDMTHSFSSNRTSGDFNTTFIANNTFVTNPFILTTVTLPVFGGPKNTFIKQAISLWFLGSIVDGFRLHYLTVGPFFNIFRRSDTQTQPLKIKEAKLGFLWFGIQFQFAHMTK